MENAECKIAGRRRTADRSAWWAAEDRTPSVALRLVLPDHLADVWLVDTVGLVALAGRARTADASQLQVPRFFGMILADPADASANRAVRVHAFDRPLKELARSRPSAVISLYSTSATNFGSTQVVLGGLRQLRFGTDHR